MHLTCFLPQTPSISGPSKQPEIGKERKDKVLIRWKQRGCRNKTMLSLVYKEFRQIVIETEMDPNIPIISSYP